MAKPDPDPILALLGFRCGPTAPPQKLPAPMEVVKQALKDHDAISCSIDGKSRLALPLSLAGDQLTAVIDPSDRCRQRTEQVISVSSISRAYLHEMRCFRHHLAYLHFAAVHRLTAQVMYLDETGSRRTAKLQPPIEEQGDFFVAGPDRVRTKWILDVCFCLDTVDASEAPALVEKLLAEPNPHIRHFAVPLALRLGEDGRLAVLRHLSSDADQAIATDAARWLTRRGPTRRRKDNPP